MIEVIGLNHKTSALDIREKLSFSTDDAICFMKHLLSVKNIEGLVLLSTCNRLEIYYQSQECRDARPCVSTFLHEEIENECLAFKNINFPVSFYHYKSDDCARHLFEVAAGLDSMILGEYQIMGQVKDAFRLSNQNECSSSVLNRLFHKAFEAGKKIRSTSQETSLSAAAASVELVSDFFSEKEHLNVLIFGAGQMAEILIDTLIKKGFKNIGIYNRSLERAEKLTQKFNIQTCSQEMLASNILEVDIIFVATSALSPILNASMLSKNLKSIICFDLSVPRNIDPSVESLKNVSLFTIDHLKGISNELPKPNLFASQKIIDEILVDFNDWLSSRKLSPVIGLLQQRFDLVLEQRLEYLKNKVSQREHMLIQQSGIYLKEKYLRSIISSLRDISEQGRNEQYLEMIHKLVQNQFVE